MNISDIIALKFENKNQSNYRLLAENPSIGILSSGYVKKDKTQGSIIDYSTNHYAGLIILSGEGIYSDNNNKNIPLKTGDFVQRFPNTMHSTIVTSNNWSELFICIGVNIYKSLSEIQVIPFNKPVLTPGLDFELIQMFLNYNKRLSTVNALELQLLVPEAIAIISKASYLDKMHSTTSIEKSILILSTTYINENINKRFSVEDVANHVNLGYEKYRKIFTKHYGISPGNYIINARIRKSQGLLSDISLSIKEIAFQLGYTDSFTFSKQFKKVTGLSPIEFRKLYFY